MLKFQIKSIFGKVIFEYEKETEKEAIKQMLAENIGKTLKEIDLSKKDLSGINFDNSRFYNNYLSKWNIGFDLISKNIKIGCKEKTISEWNKWFKAKEKYEAEPGSKDYRLIENGFKMASKWLV
jgi:uncharacterized protein YjbI with pentapeptide repeats